MKIKKRKKRSPEASVKKFSLSTINIKTKNETATEAITKFLVEKEKSRYQVTSAMTTPTEEPSSTFR